MHTCICTMFKFQRNLSNNVNRQDLQEYADDDNVTEIEIETYSPHHDDSIVIFIHAFHAREQKWEKHRTDRHTPLSEYVNTIAALFSRELRQSKGCRNLDPKMDQTNRRRNLDYKKDHRKLQMNHHGGIRR